MSLKRTLILSFIVLAIVLIPLIAMQYSEEVQWGVGDFMAAILLVSAGVFGIDRVLHSSSLLTQKLLYIILIISGVLVIWVELAVGI